LNILVTGGAGYIGSHVVLLLKEAGHTTIVYDDLSKGRKSHIFSHNFVEGSLHDTPLLKETLQTHRVDAVMHFAAFIESGESMSEPDRYFYNNTEGSLSLLRAMKESDVKQFIFSSTAALYGYPEKLPIPESSPLNPVNPYGESKLLVERILSWYSRIYGLRYVSLRYFNAAGADPELRTGELHNPETHLIPLALQAAYGEREKIFINGTDYSTPDGTCIRDYIHVTDLARAHLLSLEYLKDGGESAQFNLGSQKGYSVREVLDAVVRVTGKNLRIEEGPRRPGDPEILVASSELIGRVLGWKPHFGSLEEIIGTADAFYRKHRGL
jgi:UDP-glucose 4-epimerase